jgi:hypothetical protein
VKFSTDIIIGVRNVKALSIIVLVLLSLMNRREKVGVVDFSDDEFEEDGEDKPKSLCPHCKEYGFKVELQNRIYEGPKPADWESWKMCLDCGTVYALHEISKESQIKDVVSVSDNPFDFGVDFLAIHSRKISTRKKKKGDDFDHIHDEDLKRELKKGSILLSYSEQNAT